MNPGDSRLEDGVDRSSSDKPDVRSLFVARVDDFLSVLLGVAGGTWTKLISLLSDDTIVKCRVPLVLIKTLTIIPIIILLRVAFFGPLLVTIIVAKFKIWRIRLHHLSLNTVGTNTFF